MSKYAFQPGNQFWRLRNHSSCGPAPKFETADDLWQAAVAYFEWVEENPLQEEKLFHFQGSITRAEVSKMRAMTIAGLCLHMGVSETAWHGWRQEGGQYYRPDLAETAATIDAIIREQKFTGAAADLLNPVIIARDLGLSDKSEISGPDGGPIQTKEVSARDIVAGKLAGIAARSGTASDTGGAD